MPDEHPQSKWLALAGSASRWTAKAAKVAAEKGLKLAKTAAEAASAEIERQKALAAERRAAEEAAATEQRQLEAERRAAIEAAARHMERLRPIIAERWPEERFPRIPPAVLQKMAADSGPDANLANLQEDVPHLWQTMLDRYPTPPVTEDERKAREQLFWLHRAARFVIAMPDGGLALEPKQEILDYFESYEKWIFREYFAATGIYHKTYFSDDFAKYVMWESRPHQHVPYSKMPGSRFYMPASAARGAERGFNEARKAIVERENNKMDAEVEAFVKSRDPHFEKWSEWFFFNIEKAFKEGAQPLPEKAEPVHGDARPASEAEAQAAATGQGVRRSSVHDREF